MADDRQGQGQADSGAPKSEPPGKADAPALGTLLKSAFTSVSAVVGVLAGIAVFTGPFAKTGPGLISISVATLAAVVLIAGAGALLYENRSRPVTLPAGAIALVAAVFLAVGAGVGYLARHARPAQLTTLATTQSPAPSIARENTPSTPPATATSRPASPASPSAPSASSTAPQQGSPQAGGPSVTPVPHRPRASVSGTITFPTDATTSIPPASILHARGTARHVRPAHRLWLFLYVESVARYYPSSPGAITLAQGHWKGTIYVGGSGQSGEQFMLWLVDFGPKALQRLNSDTYGQNNGFTKLKLASDATILGSVTFTVH